MRAPFLFIAALAATPVQAGVVQINVQGPVIEVSTAQTVQANPDEAVISAGVTTRQRTAVASMQQNAQRMDAVIARLKDLGIAAADIQTSGVSLNPAYQHFQGSQPPTFLGYDVTNTVSVTLKDVRRVGTTLDALVAAGANNINGPIFRRSDDSLARETARKLAFEQAAKQAQSLARIAGYSGLRLLEVNELASQSQPFDIIVTGARAVSAQSVSTPIEPGRVGIIVQLSVKYEMTR
jgi:uncharacterized protein